LSLLWWIPLYLPYTGRANLSAMVWIVVSPRSPECYVESLTPIVMMALGSGTHGDFIRFCPYEWNHPYKGDTRELPWPFFHVRIQQQAPIYEIGNGPYQIESSLTLILDFSPSRTIGSFCCLWATQFMAFCYSNSNELRLGQESFFFFLPWAYT
jgi:hypothetical protein